MDKPRLLAGILQLSHSDKKAGFMPWSGQGQSWVSWRYPFPRPVATALLTLPLSMLQACDLELLACSGHSDDFLPLGTSMERLEDSSLPGVGHFEEATLLFVEVVPGMLCRKNVSLERPRPMQESAAGVTVAALAPLNQQPYMIPRFSKMVKNLFLLWLACTLVENRGLINTGALHGRGMAGVLGVPC